MTREDAERLVFEAAIGEDPRDVLSKRQFVALTALLVATEKEAENNYLARRFAGLLAEAEARGFARGIEAAAALLDVQGDPGAWPWAERVRALGKGAGE